MRRAPLLMPNVTESQLAPALTALRDMRLARPQTSYVASQQDRDLVLAQDPPPGREVTPRTPITLTLSDGSLVEVPDVARKTPGEAGPILAGRDLSLGGASTETSGGPAGVILRTQPPAGAVIRRRSSVNYVVAVAQPLEMPRVTDRPIDRAKAQLAALGLQEPGARTSVAEADQGVVIAQEPKPGAPVTPSTPILLTVSSGPALIPVPLLAGLTPEQAQQLLEARGLRLGAEREQASDQTPGRILGARPPERTLVRRGSAVDVFVARRVPVTTPAVPRPPQQRPPWIPQSQTAQGLDAGKVKSPAMVPVPRVVDRSENEAKQILEEAGLKATVTRGGWGAWRRDRVAKQFPDGGSAPEGSTVALTMVETLAPLLGGGAVVVAAAAVAAWSCAWPLRLRIRPGLAGEVLRSAKTVRPPTWPALAARWSVGPPDGRSAAAPAAIDPGLEVRFDWSVDFKGFQAAASRSGALVTEKG